MALKLSSLLVSRQIPRWVFSAKHFSSVSSEKISKIHDCPETHQTQKASNKREIDPKVQYLQNRLCPDELIKVLDETHDLSSALKVFKWASLQKQFRHSVGTYSRIILKLGFSGNVDDVEGFCREMAKERYSNGGEAFSALVDEFVGSGRLDEAMRVVLVMCCSGYKLGICQWNSVLGALVEEKLGFRDVLLMYKEMVKSGTAPNVNTLNCLIRSLFDSDMVDYALDQFRRMRNKRCIPNGMTYEIVVHGLLALDRVDESLDILRQMLESGVCPGSSFFVNVVPLLCRENKLGDAMRLYDKMRVLQIEPDICIYEALVKCLYANDRLGEAVEIFDEMMNDGLNPSTDVLVNIVNAQCILENLDKARNALNDCQILDPSPFNVLLKGYCDAHYFQEAKGLLCEMFLLNIHDSLSWNILIRGLCKASQVKQAHEVLGKMIISSYPPDDATYSALITGKCNLTKYDDAMRLFQQVHAMNWILDQDSYHMLIEGLCSRQKFQEAAEVSMYLLARGSTLQSSLFSGLIKGLCVTRRLDEAIQLLKLGHYFMNPINVSTYTAIMQSLVKLNKPQEALVYLSQIVKHALVLDTESYCVLIHCMSALSQTKDCVIIFNRMVSDGLLPDDETLAVLFSHLSCHSQLHTIWEVVNELRQDTDFLGPTTYNILVYGLLKEGLKPEASQLLDSMLEKGWVPDADTHRLLVGSLHGENFEVLTLEHESLGMEDEISSILSEGLGDK